MSLLTITNITVTVLAWTVMAAAAGIHYGRRAARSAVAEARAAALHDPLTGLLNRAGLEEAAAHASTPLVTAVVDLDEFKEINDTHGHQHGDAVLVATAHELRACAAPYGGSVARLGGDEFAVLLPVAWGATRTMLTDIGIRLHRSVTSAPIQTNGTAQSTVRASIGLGCMPAHGDLWAAIHEADLAMYGAKDTGAAVALTMQGLGWAGAEDGILRPVLERPLRPSWSRA